MSPEHVGRLRVANADFMMVMVVVMMMVMV